MEQEYDITESDEEVEILDNVRRSGVNRGVPLKFMPNDEVTVSGEATKYLIGKIEGGKYQLSDEKGNIAHNGRLFEEHELRSFSAGGGAAS